jgi:AraC-like DNA-binding protein
VPTAARLRGHALGLGTAMLFRHEGFRRLCDARERLRDACHSSLSIADLARDVHVSPFHFIRQFEALFGVTPHQYRIQSRLDPPSNCWRRARTPSPMSVWVGFSSSSRFSTLFAARVVAVSTSRAPADSGTRDAHTPHARVFQSDGVPSGFESGVWSRHT